MNKIKELRKQRKWTLDKLSQLTHMAPNTINQYELGKRNPSLESLVIFANVFKVSVDYLLGQENIEFIQLPKHTVKIPVYGTIPAGVPTEMIEASYIDEYIEIDADWVKNGAVYFGLKVSGDSMSPNFLDGDTLVIKKQNDCDSGNYCAVSINCTESTFKKVIKKENGITLQPLNSAYDPMFFSNQEVESLPITILGVVKEIRRSL